MCVCACVRCVGLSYKKKSRMLGGPSRGSEDGRVRFGTDSAKGAVSKRESRG